MLRAQSDPNVLDEDLKLAKSMGSNSQPPPPLGGSKSVKSVSSTSIYNLAKNELSTSKVSNEEHVAALRGRLPPGPDSRNEKRVPNSKLWLAHAEKTNVDPNTQHRYVHLLKHEKKAFQAGINASFNKNMNNSQKERILDGSHVFSVTTSSINKPTGRSIESSDANKKGIERIQMMYNAFTEEQNERLAHGEGPRQMVGLADLYINKVFANPVLRGTQIVTDPLFQAFVDRNKVAKLKKDPLDQEETNGPLLVLQPTYKIE